jgi:hypothetical protein
MCTVDNDLSQRYNVLLSWENDAVLVAMRERGE